jgi:hypothetical protein
LPAKEGVITTGATLIAGTQTQYLIKYYAYTEVSRATEGFFDDPQAIRIVIPYQTKSDPASDLLSALEEVSGRITQDLIDKKSTEYKVTFEIYDKNGVPKGKTTSTISKQGTVIIS